MAGRGIMAYYGTTRYEARKFGQQFIRNLRSARPGHGTSTSW